MKRNGRGDLGLKNVSKILNEITISRDVFLGDKEIRENDYKSQTNS